MKIKKSIDMSERELKEIYNALCCLQEKIRDIKGQKRRTNFIRKMIKEIYVIIK